MVPIEIKKRKKNWRQRLTWVELTSRFSSIQLVVFYYVAMLVLAFVLFSLPVFHLPGAKMGIVDLFFLAVSAVSVTGLTTVNIHEVFNAGGIFLLEAFFQIGGLGVMMISTFFFIVSKRKISLRQRQLIMTDMNQPRLSGTVRLIRTTMFFLLGVQVVFGLLFTLYFYWTKQQPTASKALFYGMYEAISAVTNSGFDITGSSLIPYIHRPFFLLTIMLLIIIGGIGFPVIMEMWEWFLHMRSPQKLPYRFTLFTKMAVSSFLFLFVLGTVIIFMLEWRHSFARLGGAESLLRSMFYSISTRNAGFQVNSLAEFQPATLIVFSILMFIGCSPSSVGGGIRTTTIAILFLYIIAFLKGNEHLSIFGRRIDEDDVRKSIVIFMLSFTLCLGAVLVLSVSENQSFLSLIVEVTSAFGTTGLSLGITSDLTAFGKIIIAILMFVGRIGMLYTLLIFVPKEKKDLGYVYPSEKIIIG